MNTAYPEIKKEWKLKSTVVYGPFPTRRKGRAIGINVLAINEKFCSFDCVYCQCGWTRDFDPSLARPEHYLSLEEIETELQRSFEEIATAKKEAHSIVLSGNGEPTLHPQFDKVVEILVAVRNRFFPKLQIQCLTAGTELHRPEVVAGLNLLERPTFKLDAAEPRNLRKLNRPLVGYSLEKLPEQLEQIKEVFLQSCFFDGRISNVSEEALTAYYELVAKIRPKEVEMYSIHRDPPAKGLKSVDIDFLNKIAETLEKKAGISSLVV